MSAGYGRSDPASVAATATKPNAAAPRGLARTRALVAVSPLPCVAIGGIGPGNVADVRGAGVAGVALVSAVCAAPDPTAAAHTLSATRHLGAGLHTGARR